MHFIKPNPPKTKNTKSLCAAKHYGRWWHLGGLLSENDDKQQGSKQKKSFSVTIFSLSKKKTKTDFTNLLWICLHLLSAGN